MKFRTYIVLLMATMIRINADAQPEDTTGILLSRDEQLIFAADAGDTARVSRLVSMGADVDASNPDGVTSLMYATQNGNLPMMNLLIRCGADPDKKPANGFTALITAIVNGQPDLVEFLLRNGASVDLADNNKMTPLMHAIEVDSFYLPDMLLYYNAPVDNRRRDGLDALMLASWLDRYEIASELLELGANVNSTDNYGLTPLHYAASAGNLEIINLLIGEGALLEAKTTSGMTPLSVAVAKNKFPASRLLIASGANVNSRISSSLNPLSLAEESAMDSITAMLRNNGARRIIWPWFNQMTLGGHFIFNRDDFLAGINLGMSDRKYNIWTSLGYDVRPKSIRIIVPDKGNNYFQYWERRHLVSFTLEKAFLFPKKSKKVKAGFVAGFQECMSFGTYSGSYLGPETQLIFSPRAGAVFQNHHLRFRLNYQFLDLHLRDMSKNWCDFSVELLFNRKKVKPDQNSITGL